METPSEWHVQEACPAADDAVWRKHASGFVEAFIVPTKRERWLELLTKRPHRIGRYSHKMHSDLDRRTGRRVESFSSAGLKGEGVFYAFADLPRVVRAELAARAAGGRDAIFSLVPGKVAVYFFHEDEVWVCQAT
ncbi:MAG: hypothetical protein K8T89_22305 [Planctomycetes bacterium]|nr:hypothetical protein [Planctomycetota bacterium]